ncbi:putative oxidoreductase TM_0325 [Tachypleus tridentatus]|uniref:putative oxidoreductase TM_0325 n=1 Tax=Tachypleus tridentatus TaxID=6853 RepID=UPI003FD4E41D
MTISISTDKKLDQKVAIITGASSGIGRAIAVLFSRVGAKLALTGRNQENLAKSAVECEAVSPYNLKSLCIVGDLTIKSDIERITKSTIDTYGRLDILVNNAGIAALDSAEDGSLATLDLVWKTNVRPGVIETNIFSTVGLDAKEVMKEATQSYPLGRGGQPQEVANAIAFLASDEASFVTGETMVIDGAKTVESR